MKDDKVHIITKCVTGIDKHVVMFETFCYSNIVKETTNRLAIEDAFVIPCYKRDRRKYRRFKYETA